MGLMEPRIGQLETVVVVGFFGRFVALPFDEFNVVRIVVDDDCLELL